LKTGTTTEMSIWAGAVIGDTIAQSAVTLQSGVENGRI
jgi:hypothetical protein